MEPQRRPKRKQHDYLTLFTVPYYRSHAINHEPLSSLSVVQIIPPLTLRAVVLGPTFSINIARSVSDGFGAVESRLGKCFVRG